VGRRLGQHFLFDPGILGRIADAAGLAPTETVLEIGPGKGTLTRELARRAARVIAIEADQALARDLAAAAEPGVTVMTGDALVVDWPPVDVVAGNIPYQITTPLIERALRAPRPRVIVFLVQREVADRLGAAPGGREYGALTAGVGLVATVETLFTVRAGAFHPPPKVDSAVVRITPRGDPLVRDGAEEMLVRALIQRCFQRRRQQMRRTLREFWGVTADEAATCLRAVNATPETRPEALSPEQFVALARSRPTA